MRSFIALIKTWINKILVFLHIRSEDEPIDPDPTAVPPEVICYYGCPNSKKAQKLQLNQKLCK